MTRNKILGALAIVFGLLTLASGGRVLFGPEEGRLAAGAVVSWVLWFNFASGMAYIAAGAGIIRGRYWAVLLARLLVAAIFMVTLAFLGHIASGLAWEPRTLGALGLRLGFWVVLAIYASPTKRSLSD